MQDIVAGVMKRYELSINNQMIASAIYFKKIFYYYKKILFFAKALSKLAAPAQVDDLAEVSSKYVLSPMDMVTRF